MKVLIWFGCIFVATMLNTLLGYATGVKVGYVIFYFGVYSVARRLCDKWDKHKSKKTENNKTYALKNQPIIEPTTNATNEIRFCRKCGEKLIDSSKFCRKCGAEIVEIDEFIDTDTVNMEFCKKCGADVSNDIDICHVCGEKKGID